MTTIDGLLAPVFLDVPSSPHFLAACRLYKVSSKQPAQTNISAPNDRSARAQASFRLQHSKLRILVVYRDKKDQKIRIAKLKLKNAQPWATNSIPSPLAMDMRTDLNEAFTSASKKSFKGSHVSDLVGGLEVPQELMVRLQKEGQWWGTHILQTMHIGGGGSTSAVNFEAWPDEYRKRGLVIVFKNRQPKRFVAQLLPERDSFVNALVQFADTPIQLHKLSVSLSGYASSSTSSAEKRGQNAQALTVHKDSNVGGALLTEQDAEDLSKFLMNDIADLEASISRLNQEFSSLESANIHAILSSESLVSKDILRPLEALMVSLDDTAAYLDLYAVKLHVLGQDMAAIESRNNTLQIRAANHGKLKRTLDQLLSLIKIDTSHTRVLSQAPRVFSRVAEVLSQSAQAAASSALNSRAAAAPRAFDLEPFALDDDDIGEEEDDGVSRGCVSLFAEPLYQKLSTAYDWFNPTLFPRHWASPRLNIPPLLSLIEAVLALQKSLSTFADASSRIEVDGHPIVVTHFVKMAAVRGQLREMSELLDSLRSQLSTFLGNMVGQDVIDFLQQFTKKKKDFSEELRPLKFSYRWRKYVVLVPLIESLRAVYKQHDSNDLGQDRDGYELFSLEDDEASSDKGACSTWNPLDGVSQYARPLQAAYRKDMEYVTHALCKRVVKASRKESDFRQPSSADACISSPWGTWQIGADAPELSLFSAVFLDQRSLSSLSSSFANDSSSHQRTGSGSSSSTVTARDAEGAKSTKEVRVRSDEAFRAVLDEISYAVSAEYLLTGILLHGVSLLPLLSRSFPPVEPSNLISSSSDEYQSFVASQPVQDTLSSVDPLVDIMFCEGLRSSFQEFAHYFESKCNRFFAVRMLDDVRARMLDAQKRGLVAFQRLYTEMQLALRNVLNSCTEKQCEAVRDYACTTRRVGVLPFVATFSAMMEYLMAIAFGDKRSGGQREDESVVCDLITKYGRSVIDKVSTLSVSDPKYGRILQMENLYYMCHSLGSRFRISHKDTLAVMDTISSSQSSQRKRGIAVPTVLHRYLAESYESASVARETVMQSELEHRLPKAAAFFAGIAKLFQQGFPAEEIAFQTDFSRQKLHDIVFPSICSNIVLRKAIADIRERMLEKHLTSGKVYAVIEGRLPGSDWDGDLWNWTWARFRGWFVDVYKSWETSITRCYPATSMPVDSSELKRILQAIDAHEETRKPDRK